MNLASTMFLTGWVILSVVTPVQSWSQWVRTNAPAVTCFAVSGTNVFAGTYGNGVYLSTDSGTSWRAVNTGLKNTYVNSLEVSGPNLIVGSWGGLSHSPDSGSNWTVVGSELPTLTDVMALVVNGTNVFAGTDWRYGAEMRSIKNGGIFRSTDGGATWNTSSVGLPSLPVGIWAFATEGSLVFAASHSDVFISADSGASWNTTSPLSYPIVQALAVSDTRVFAGTMYGGVLISTNNGATWPSTGILTNPDVQALAVSGTNVFAGTMGSGVFLSTNNGTTWKAVNAGLIDTSFSDSLRKTVSTQLTTSSVTALAIVGTNIFAGTIAGVWRRPLSELITAVDFAPTDLPESFTLEQNFPNPFNPTTTIKYELPRASPVNLSVYDMLGRQVSVLVNAKRDAGVYEVKFDGSTLASGVYFYRLQAGGAVQTKRLLLIR